MLWSSYVILGALICLIFLGSSWDSKYPFLGGKEEIHSCSTLFYSLIQCNSHISWHFYYKNSKTYFRSRACNTLFCLLIVSCVWALQHNHLCEGIRLCSSPWVQDRFWLSCAAPALTAGQWALQNCQHPKHTETKPVMLLRENEKRKPLKSECPSKLRVVMLNKCS